MNGTEMEAKPEAHTHDTGDITDFPSTMPPSAHDHEISEVNGLQTALDDKLDKTGGTITGDVAIEGVQEIRDGLPRIDLISTDDTVLPVKGRLDLNNNKLEFQLRDANDDSFLETPLSINYTDGTTIPKISATPSGWTLESMASSADAITTKEYVDDMSPILVLTYDGVNDTIIHSKGNFGSVTMTSTGIYDVTFDTALPDANYTVSLTGSFSNNSHMTGYLDYHTTLPTADGFTVRLRNNDADFKNSVFSVIVYR